MSLETGIKTALTNDATVNALVSGRIYPEIMPFDVTMPAITYQRTSTTPYQTLEAVDDFTMVIFQVDCWSESYSEAKSVADAVKGAIHGVRTLGAQSVFHCFLTSMQDLSEIDGDRSIRRISMDFQVYLNE